MKVVLIYAKSQTLRGRVANTYAEEDTTRGEYSRDEIYPPLGISTLAARLESLGGYEVRLIDDSLDSIEEIRAGMEWADAVGISSLTPNAKRARELGLISRKEYGKPTVLGGPHPTTNPEYFLEAGAADICVQGEGDLTLPEVLQAIDRPETWDSIQGITFLKDGEVHATPRRELVKNMNEVPWPAYHLYDMTKYFRTMVTPGISIMTSRGCPFSCTFCDAEMTPRQYRAMTPENAVDLIQHLLETYNPPQIFIFDDLFTIQRKRVIGICKEIVKRDLCFEWSCESRVDTVDFEMLRWMRRAGCVKIYFGLESGSPNVLVTMKKDVTPEKILAGSRVTRQIGIYYKFFILYGFPSDTEEDHRLTEDLVAEARPSAVSVSILVPIPGTEVYEQIKHELVGDVTETEFHFWHHTEMWKHPRFTHDELITERERLLKRHKAVVSGMRHKLLKKWERLVITVRHPVLLLDFVDIMRRKRKHRARIAKQWGSVLKRDPLSMQIPSVKVN
ncbi:MAG: cobalamin B12-binding domain-containing protein [Planctomycetes bacterium]|nr:cobalamin B12-binding domain-containing protein [Planctomycetota bacterium]